MAGQVVTTPSASVSQRLRRWKGPARLVVMNNNDNNSPVHPNQITEVIASYLAANQPSPDVTVKIRCGRNVPAVMLPPGYTFDRTRVTKADHEAWDHFCPPNAIQIWWFGHRGGAQIEVLPAG